MLTVEQVIFGLGFTRRELEVACYLADGMPRKEIASCLAISPHTVRVHEREIRGKLAVVHRCEAVARLRDMGFRGPAKLKDNRM